MRKFFFKCVVKYFSVFVDQMTDGAVLIFFLMWFAFPNEVNLNFLSVTSVRCAALRQRGFQKRSLLNHGGLCAG